MPEICSPNDCPVSVRVEALEREFDRYRGARQTVGKPGGLRAERSGRGVHSMDGIRYAGAEITRRYI